MSNDITKKLVEMKKQIEENVNKRAQLLGEKNQLNKQLEEKFGCNTVKQAKEKLETLQAKTDKINNQISKGLNKLEADYDWT